MLSADHGMQVEVKARQISELNTALQAAATDIKVERMHASETDQMLTREKKLAATLRDELDSLKKQMSAEKDKLSSALKKNAASEAQLIGVLLSAALCTPWIFSLTCLGAVYCNEFPKV